MRGQKALVLRLLRERGSRGVNAHELVYTHGITRGAAVVHELQKEGIEIESFVEPNKLATYVLKDAVRPAPRVCECGHLERRHVSGFRCMDTTEDGYCRCEKFRA